MTLTAVPTGTLLPTATITHSPLCDLLVDAELVGGAYDLGFTAALVVTNDFDKARIGGLPRHAFLLAAAVQPADPTVVDPEEVFLLRVRDTAPLPSQPEMLTTRLTTITAAADRRQPVDTVIDPWTQHQISQCAYRCDILGTYFVDVVNGQPYVAWGSDVDNVPAAPSFLVWMPSPQALARITEHPAQTRAEAAVGGLPATVPIGTVRYAATRRRARDNRRDTVPVRVRVEDFVSGRKTAVFGMTRTGKSNVMKTIACAVFEHAAATGTRIGQLIFDPQGEYAAVNQQDHTGLRLLGAHAPGQPVKVYKMTPDRTRPEEQSLAMNFYDPAEIDTVWDMLTDTVAAETTAYARDFCSATLLPPPREAFATAADHRAATIAAERGQLALYALLADVGYRLPPRFTCSFAMAKATADAFHADHPGTTLALAGRRGGRYMVTSPQDALLLVRWLADMIDANDPRADTWKRCDPFTAVLAVVTRSVGTAVRSRITALADFHDPHAVGNLPDLVWDDMHAGRLVIIDLSVGSDVATKRLSERLVWGVLARANHRFRGNQPTIPMQIMVEEAHVLFDRRKGDTSAAADDPWVTLAKQSAKFDIGLVYATQEVSGVDPRILNNTANWLVGHLNNDAELRELARYYDFAAFTDSLRTADDPGFFRIKPYSGKYILPTQIAKFDHAMVTRARAAAGYPPVTADGTLTPNRGH